MRISKNLKAAVVIKGPIALPRTMDGMNHTMCSIVRVYSLPDVLFYSINQQGGGKGVLYRNKHSLDRNTASCHILLIIILACSSCRHSSSVRVITT